MKSLRRLSVVPLLAAFVLSLSAPLYALDPHYAGTVTVVDQSYTSTAAAEADSITSLAPGTVNSGTNSFVITANVRFTAPLGDAVQLQLYKTVSGVTTVLPNTAIQIRGDGDIVITTELESVAASTTLGVSVLFNVAGLPVKIKKCTLTAVGLAGSSV